MWRLFGIGVRALAHSIGGLDWLIVGLDCAATGYNIGNGILGIWCMLLNLASRSKIRAGGIFDDMQSQRPKRIKVLVFLSMAMGNQEPSISLVL